MFDFLNPCCCSSTTDRKQAVLVHLDSEMPVVSANARSNSKDADRLQESGSQHSKVRSCSPSQGTPAADCAEKTIAPGLELASASEHQRSALTKDEQNFVSSRLVVNRMLARLQSLEENPMLIEKQAVGSHKLKEEDVSRFIDSGDLVLPFPINFAGAELLRGHYCRHGAAIPLHVDVASNLISQFTKAYTKAHPRAVAEVKSFEHELIVVGDLHGQLQDLLLIFHSYGAPSAQRIYLFNGNIADRGPNGSEIYLLLFAYFLADATSIVINRGNHEDEHWHAQDASQGGGFLDEVLNKFGKQDSRKSHIIYRKFVEAMKVFSLCVVVSNGLFEEKNKDLFVVHGGLATATDVPNWSLSIDFIKSIDHTEFTQPDLHSAVLQDLVWKELMWSDPCDKFGSTPCKSGAGIHFGPDVTAKFLTHNPNIKFIVRSHSLPAPKKANKTKQGVKTRQHDHEGYASTHGGRVMTVFSASNFGGASNNGAVFRYQRNSFPYEDPKTYSAPSLQTINKLTEASVNKNSDRPSASLQDWAAEGELAKNEASEKFQKTWWKEELSRLMVAIVEQKHVIRKKFLEDFEKKTLVTKSEWQSLLVAGVGKDFKFNMAWDFWKLQEGLNFADFLKCFRVVVNQEKYTSFKFNVTSRFFDAVLHESASLEATLHEFDKNGNGTVDLNEMREALRTLSLDVSSAQLDFLLHIFFEDSQEDENGVAVVPIDEFLARFAIMYRHSVDATNRGECSEEERMLHEEIGMIGHAIAVCSMEDLETSLRVDESPRRNNGEKETIAETAQCPARKKGEKDTLVENAKKPRKSMHRKPKAKEPTPPQKEKVSKAATKSTAHSVGKNLTVKIERVFAILDASQDGFIDTEEFVKGIAKIPGVLNSRLSDGQYQDETHLRCLCKSLETHNRISILQFLEAFCFEDDSNVADAFTDSMMTILFCHRHAIRTTCRHFEQDHKIRKNNFLLVLQALNAEITEGGSHFTQSQMQDLCDSVASPDQDNLDWITYEDLFDAMEVVYSGNSSIAASVKTMPAETKKRRLSKESTGSKGSRVSK